MSGDDLPKPVKAAAIVALALIAYNLATHAIAPKRKKARSRA